MQTVSTLNTSSMTNPFRHHVWAKLAAFDHPQSARSLFEYVNGHGFVARLYDERNLQRYWFLAKPMAGLCVLVPEATLPEVHEFLAGKPEGSFLIKRAIHCPSCHSTRIQYPQMTRKNLMPTLVAHLLVALHLMEHECYCEDCHYAWVRGSRSGARGLRAPLFSSQR